MLRGGILIANVLREDKWIEVFDISFNSLGGGPLGREPEQIEKLKQESAQAWSDCFKYNQSLVHMDISHNSLDQPTVTVLSEGLRLNHSILGLHMMGNQGQIDSEGFIVDT